ncbi:hypothetical protein IV203_008829 [Nitzschia inconspicua]|uniref:Uncharacterized protein n=1 Tax=Nitzschia inconspicua TaxID=303405 RepID=A0A9K3PN23_9STRA|nr:hypothetical protein IV203_008829 [Nitzschia inconspicua]
MAVTTPSVLSELDRFLNSKKADDGLTDIARSMIMEIPGDEDAAYKYFANIVVPNASQASNVAEDPSKMDQYDDDLLAARSYRAMTMLKQDLSSMTGYPRVLIKNPAQAGLLAKDLFAGLSVPDRQRYSTLHMRELLDTLVETFPEKVMSAAAAGGKKGIQDHLTPLLRSDQTLPVLTHLVCFGCTGRKGIASAEKSAAHTARLYQYNMQQPKISMGQRKKFVRACMDFQLMEQLAHALTAATSDSAVEVGEEVCEAILTMIELIGYPPDEVSHANQQGKQEDEVVGEDVLLSPLATADWWSELLICLQQPSCTSQQRLAISRTCMHAFALATGNSSRICKSHAPATDATEQVSEIVQEKEEHLTNRIVEWGLTNKIHEALVSQIPLIVQALQLPDHEILSYNATFSTQEGAESVDLPMIRHPGKYQTVPLGSWRLQLLGLLKEIIVYRRSESGKGKGKNHTTIQALDAIMQLPLSPEVSKSKKEGEEKTNEEGDMVIFNPWPALCSYIWAYPNNDFYGILFFEMFRSAVLEHHEATLRVILQKAKFLTRSVKTVVSGGPLTGVLLNCLNLLRLRALSLAQNEFLPQYLNSHDGWKEHCDVIIQMTIKQQTPIKGDGTVPSIGLGSKYSQQLGLDGIEEFEPTSAASQDETKTAGEAPAEDSGTKKGGIKKKKKKNKKKH